MIYTVTLNLSADYVVSVDGFAAGKLNRTQQTHVFPAAGSMFHRAGQNWHSQPRIGLSGRAYRE